MAQPVDYYGAGYGNVGYGAPISSDMMNSYYQNGYYGGGMTGTMLDYFMPNRLVLEPFVYAHYNLSIANYAGGEVPYSTIFNKTLPAGFGVAVGVRVNRIFLAEFDITGASDRKVSTIQGVDYLQKTDFVFLRFNLGLSIPISGTNRPYGRSFMEEILMSKHDKKVNILILGGFITAFRNVSFGDGKIPPNAIGTTMGVLPEVGGGLDRDIIAEIIKGELGQIRYCYERQLSAHPELYGKMQIKFTIGLDGAVAEQRIGSTTLKNADVEGCILRRVARWKFPQPKGGTTVLVSYPFLLKSND
jgi:hypothetical protein